MRLRLEDPSLLDDLLGFLRRDGFLALKSGADTIEVQVLNSVSDRFDRAQLSEGLESWLGRHARVEML